MVNRESFPRGRVTAGSFWPPYTPRTGEKARKRVFAWLTVSKKNNSLEVLDEYGATYQFKFHEYEAIRDLATDRGWVLFAKFQGGTAQHYPHLGRALHDRQATILASARKITRSSAVCGIEWRSGRRRARLIDPDVWGFSQCVKDGVHVSPLTFLLYCRRCCDLLGMGDYDTPASLGTAKIYTDWQSANNRKNWILPRRLRALLASNPVHPRIYDIDTPAVYALLRERDLRSAYARALKGSLALGQPCYYAASEAASHVVWGCTPAEDHSPEKAGICFGAWEVQVPEDLQYGPVSRVWAPGQSAVFSVGQGTYRVPLWGEEADALAEVGCTLIWLGGWIWHQVGKPFEGFVNELSRLRKWADDSKRPVLSEMLKRIPNAVVGRFNCTESCTIVAESEAVSGDILFPLDWDGSLIPDELAALHVNDARETATPVHWYSYIVMKVGLQIWRAQREELSRGLLVTSANIDSYRVVQPTIDFTPLQDTEHWREFLIRDAKIEASRYIDGWKSSDGGQTWTRIIRAPGVKRE